MTWDSGIESAETISPVTARRNTKAAEAALGETVGTHAIAVAEQTLKFEHRDLHWGNILVRDCQEKTISFLNGSTSQQRFEVETMGVCATIIDFSLR